MNNTTGGGADAKEGGAEAERVGAGQKRKREERRITCVNSREEQKTESRTRVCVCVCSYRCECVLAGVRPDCSSVQSLYRLTSCVSVTTEATCRDMPLVRASGNKAVQSFRAES